MTYLEELESSEKKYQRVIDELSKKYKVQFVSAGYMELIVPSESIKGFMEELTKNKIVINFLSWWCHCTPENEKKYGCPHGLGGPHSLYFDGWYSETQIQAWEFSPRELSAFNKDPSTKKIKEINDDALSAILSINQDQYYTPCLVPAFGLFVPQKWGNKSNIAEWDTENFL